MPSNLWEPARSKCESFLDGCIFKPAKDSTDKPFWKWVHNPDRCIHTSFEETIEKNLTLCFLSSQAGHSCYGPSHQPPFSCPVTAISHMVRELLESKDCLIILYITPCVYYAVATHSISYMLLRSYTTSLWLNFHIFRARNSRLNSIHSYLATLNSNFPPSSIFKGLCDYIGPTR